MSIASELTYLQGTKEVIRQAIIDKDVDISINDTFRSYANKIAEIESGGTGEYVKVRYNNYCDGADYKPYGENYTVVVPDGTDVIYLKDPCVWEWNNTIYIGLGQLTSNSYGNNKVYKFNKNTLEYIGSFTAGTVGFVCTNSNVHIYNNKAFFATGNTYPTSSSTATINANLRILDLETETMSNGVAIPNISTYCTIFTGKWCFSIDNTYVSTAANTNSYLIDLDAPTSRYTITTGTNSSKAIGFNDRFAFWAGGGSSGVNTVVKFEFSTRTLTTLPTLPRVSNMMDIVCNDKYFWVFGGWQANNSSKELIQYNLENNERTIISLNYDICEPLARVSSFGCAKIKKNLYFRKINTTYINNFLIFDTTENDWYVNKKGLKYCPFVVGKVNSGNGCITISHFWINENNIAYSCYVGGSMPTEYSSGQGGLFTIADINKYITIPTPNGCKVKIGNGDEFEPDTPTIKVLSPFTGYVKYK